MNLAVGGKQEYTYFREEKEIIWTVEGCTVVAALAIECYLLKKMPRIPVYRFSSYSKLSNRNIIIKK